jgi:succinyl-diaminopimelate desuccinylase
MGLGNSLNFSSQTESSKVAHAPSAALRLLQEAVRCNTVSSHAREEVFARMLGDVLDNAGIPFDLRVSQSGGANLTATLKGAHPGPRLVLSGHLDTVPIGDQEWSHPPFDAQIVGDRLYGRGTADMKGGVIALLMAFVDAKGRLDTMAGELVFAATYGEEVGSEGALQMLDDEQLGAFGAMIIAEPTSNRPISAHKGALWIEVTASGRTSHSSAPDEGINAIDLIHSFRQKLDLLDLSSDPDGYLTPSTMAVTRISGGKGNNVIPDTCSMTIDFRTLPGQDHAALLKTLRSIAAGLADDVPGSSLAVVALIDLPSVKTAANSPVIEAIQIALEGAGRGRSAVGAANYFTDASVFQRAGADIVVIGPGRADQAHQTDEFIEISEFHAAIGIYAAAIQTFHRAGSPTPPRPKGKVI